MNSYLLNEPSLYEMKKYVSLLWCQIEGAISYIYLFLKIIYF